MDEPVIPGSSPEPVKNKEYYETEKLKAEIKELNKNFFRRPASWQFLSPVIVAICSIIFLFFNGYFDAQNKYRMAQKENLEFQIGRFSSQKDSLYGKVAALDSVKRKLLAGIDSANYARALVENALKYANDSLRRKDRYISDLLKAYNECYAFRKAISEIKNSANRGVSGSMSSYGPVTAIVSLPDPKEKERKRLNDSSGLYPQPIVNTRDEFKKAEQLKKKKKQIH